MINPRMKQAQHAMHAQEYEIESQQLHKNVCMYSQHWGGEGGSLELNGQSLLSQHIPDSVRFPFAKGEVEKIEEDTEASIHMHT